MAGGSGLFSSEVYGFATVKTDKADYAPGSTVTITGSGWQPGETVTLTLLESPNLDTHPEMTAVADGLGNILNAQFPPDIHDLNVKFSLTATGSSAQAQTSFTDGIPPEPTYGTAVKDGNPDTGGSGAEWQYLPSPGYPDGYDFWGGMYVARDATKQSLISKKFHLNPNEPELSPWKDIVRKIKEPKHEVTIAIVGKYTGLKDSYKSLMEALIHGGIANDARVNLHWIDSEQIEVHGPERFLSEVDGILVPGGFGYRGIEGKVKAVKFAREKKISVLRLLFGYAMRCY